MGEADVVTMDARVSQQLSTLLSSVRRHLHMHPEVGFQEHATSAFIRRVLEMHGMVPGPPIAGTGVYVDIVGSPTGRAVGYRADIDALPIQDEKTVPYASTVPGVAHLCGHDAHTAVAIGVAVLLHELRDTLEGTARIFFQPNEEGNPSGAPRMIEAGILEGLEAVYAMHVDPTLEVGKIGLISGAISAAADQFRITIRGGSTGHSSRPHEHVDTVWIAVQVANALYQMLGRITDARSPAVLTICRLRGGEAYNVIPAAVEMGGTLRSTDPAGRDRIKGHIRTIAESIASLYGAQAEVNILSGSPAVLNDRRLVAHVDECARRLIGPDAVYRVPRPSMGSEDFAHYVQHIPGALVRLGTSSGPDTRHTLHDGLFDLDEASLAPGARLMAQVILGHLDQGVLAPDDV